MQGLRRGGALADYAQRGPPHVRLMAMPVRVQAPGATLFLIARP